MASSKQIQQLIEKYEDTKLQQNLYAPLNDEIKEDENEADENDDSEEEKNNRNNEFSKSHLLN